MIATVTLNPAIDKSVTVRGLAEGETNRVEVERVDAGGKGINVAKVLKRLGVEVCALGFEAGRNGRFILDALKAEGIPADFTHVPGETRLNLKVHDAEKGIETELNESGFRVSAEHLVDIRQKVARYSAECEFMIFSGSLPLDTPPKIFADLMEIARENRAKCILDTGAPALELGLASGPYLIKPNRAEVEDLLLRPLESRPELIAAARELIRRGAGQVLISLGAEGAVGVAGSDALFAAPPPVSVRSSVGAGDTMVAVMAYAAIKGLPFRDAFQMAVAASAATVAMEGTRVADLAAIEALIPKVTLEAVEE